MRPLASWAIDSEHIRARGIIIIPLARKSSEPAFEEKQNNGNFFNKHLGYVSEEEVDKLMQTA